MNKFYFDDRSFECIKAFNNLENVIVTIHWKYGNDIVKISGCNGFPEPDPKQFISFDKLTHDEINQWLFNANNIEELNKFVHNELEQLEINNNKLILPPPFDI